MELATELAQALLRPVQRGTIIESDSERQLLGPGGSLVSQLCRLFDQVGAELRDMLSLQPDLPPRRPHAWGLLTEDETPAWALMALRNPPPISATHTARLIRHLTSAHQAMPVQRARAWAATAAGGDLADQMLAELSGSQPPTWAMLVAVSVSVQAQHAMLSQWGVLSAYVGLAPQLKTAAAQQVLKALQSDCLLIKHPARLTEVALWSVLGLLHGGLACPDRAQIMALAKAMRSLQSIEEVVPSAAALGEALATILNQATLPLGEIVSEMWSGRCSSTSDPIIGVQIVFQPGETAYWFRRGRQVQLIGCRNATVCAWNWTLIPAATEPPLSLPTR